MSQNILCALGNGICLSTKRQRKPTKKILESSIEAEPVLTSKKKVCVTNSVYGLGG